MRLTLPAKGAAFSRLPTVVQAQQGPGRCRGADERDSRGWYDEHDVHDFYELGCRD